MIGAAIPSGFIDFANTVFHCPHCNTQHNDDNDKYLDRCNRNKTGCTRITCTCGQHFYMTYDITGDAISFK